MRRIIEGTEYLFPTGETMLLSDLDSKFKGIWLRAMNQPSLGNY